MKVAVLGSSGMLGSKMLEICQASGLETKGLSLPNFDAENPDFSQISDGQRQRIMLARAVCQKPESMVLDEPTSVLAVRHKIELLDILLEMAV